METVAIQAETSVNKQRSLARMAVARNRTPVVGFDRLVNVHIDGWQHVLVGSDVMDGMYGVFFEPDSVMPTNVSWLDQKLWGSTIKTIRIRGALSQGLFIPFGSFPFDIGDKLAELEEGADVTELLGITKRADDTQDVIAGNGKGLLPFCYRVHNPPPKTDEPRIQNSKDIHRALHGRRYEVTLKIDGMSVTYAQSREPPHDLVVCSRNYTVTDTKSIYHQVAKLYDIHNKLRSLNGPSQPPRYVIQGEIYGVSIQNNLLNVSEQQRYKFAVFNVWDSEECKYVSSPAVIVGLVLVGLQLDLVPLIKFDWRFDADVDTPAKLLEDVKSHCYEGTKNPIEGWVVRSADDASERISFKVINDVYLELKDKPKSSKAKKSKN